MEFSLLDKINLACLRGAGALIGATGFTGIRCLGNGLGRLAWQLLNFRREVTIRNIAEHLCLPEDEAARIAQESFRHTFRSFAEMLLTHKMGLHLRGSRLIIDDFDMFRELMTCDRPIVASTAHFGAWELLAGLLGDFRQYAPEKPLLLVVRQYPNLAVQQFIAERRQSRGITMVGHRSVAPQVLKALRKNGVVAFLVDHKPVRSEAIYLPFLHEKTAVNMGPALLAVRAEALIMPVFLARVGENYRLIVRPALDTRTLTGSREEKINAAAQFYTDAVATVVQEYPEQWVWMHNRWKAPV